VQELVPDPSGTLLGSFLFQPGDLPIQTYDIQDQSQEYDNKYRHYHIDLSIGPQLVSHFHVL